MWFDPSLRSLALWTLPFLLSFSFGAQIPPVQAAPPASSPHIGFAPDGTVSSFVCETGGEDLVVKEKPGRGFYLVTIDGARAPSAGLTQETRLDRVEQTGNSLVVSKGGNIPRFTFEVSSGSHYLALKLKRVEGAPAKSLAALQFEMFCSTPMLSVRLDYMAGVEIRGGEARAGWNYLWHHNTADPLGAIALYAAGDSDKEDEALYEIWTGEDFPRPAVKEPWTTERARRWVGDFVKRYSDQTAMIVAAQSPDQLYRLTEYAERAGFKEIYFLTDTWREEYWPIKYSHVRVNPAVFPGGLADLQKYAEYLSKRGMFMGLHYTGAGIGPLDPKRILGHVSRDLASWGKGVLEEPIDNTTATLLFRPASGTEIPIDLVGGSPGLTWGFDRNYVRIDEEILRVGSFENTDQPVWTLRDCVRGWRTIPKAAHAKGAECVGLLSPYSQVFIPDLDSPLIEQMAEEYADLANAVGAGIISYDGYEIQGQYPWGPRKFSDLVSRHLDHPTLSHTSGGVPVESSLEYGFSAAKKAVPRGTGGMVTGSIMTEGHRRATSLLDLNFEISYQVARGGRQFLLMKPEPMFGITLDTLEKHGLADRILDSFRLWKEVALKLTPEQRKMLSEKFAPVKSRLGQGCPGNSESPDVFVIREVGDAYELVPTRVMTRKEGDVRWLCGGEFGPIGPRQFIRPNDAPLEVENPYAPQPASFIIHVLPGFVFGVEAKTAATSVTRESAAIESYRTGADAKGPPPSAQTPKSPESGADLQPQASEIQNQRFAQFQQEGNAIIVSAENPKAEDVWIENGLPTWNRSFSMSKGRAISMDVTGDGSGAVLVLQTLLSGTRDYVVKINFTGKRAIVIPSGEVAWANGYWGWRFGAKYFDYSGNVGALALGFGYIPAKTSPRVKVENLQLLGERKSRLLHPVIRTGAGQLAINGEIATGQYLRYDAGDSPNAPGKAGVYDENWNKVDDLKVTLKDYAMPTGFAPVSVEVVAVGPRPWLEVQFITQDDPMRVRK